MTPSRPLAVALPDGRSLDVLVAGEGNGVLVFHDGTPTAPTEFPALWDAAAAHDLRVVSWARPGYAGSTPQPRRRVADVVTDAQSVLAALDATEQQRLVLGWSGGGPHALAHAALDESCVGAAVIGSVAPITAMSRQEWLAGMGAENVEEFSAAMTGASALEAWLQQVAVALAHVTGEGLAAGFGDVIDEVDAAAIRLPGMADRLAAAMRRAVSTGISGWRDDDLAFVAPWGFDVERIGRPVTLWHGGHDRMVPVEHAELLAGLVPSARSWIFPDEGHLSFVARLDEVISDLVGRRAG